MLHALIHRRTNDHVQKKQQPRCIPNQVSVVMFRLLTHDVLEVSLHSSEASQLFCLETKSSGTNSTVMMTYLVLSFRFATVVLVSATSPVTLANLSRNPRSTTPRAKSFMFKHKRGQISSCRTCWNMLHIQSKIQSRENSRYKRLRQCNAPVYFHITLTYLKIIHLNLLYGDTNIKILWPGTATCNFQVSTFSSYDQLTHLVRILNTA